MFQLEPEIVVPYRRKTKIGHKKTGSNRTRPFISVDTETYHNEDGKERVMLFGFSVGAYVKGNDITSLEMLYLCRNVAIAHAIQRPIYVSYGFRYDVSFLLRDMPYNVAERIWKSQATRWYGMRFEYRREKWFRISANDWTMTIYEVSSFFNKMKLHDAARKHLPNHPDVDLVSSGKSLRGQFSLDMFDSDVLPYWEAEQRLLCSLMNRLRDNFIDAHLPIPRDWYGPSAATSAVFKKMGVKAHMRSQVELPSDFVMACRYAYFGGRFEQFAGGYRDGPVYQYDITSAYPYAMTKLWSWQNTHVEQIFSFDRTKPFPEEYQFAVFEVEFIYRGDPLSAMVVPQPLPMRNHRGAIYFPHRVRGWYWAPEIRNLWYSGHVRILSAWVIRDTGIRPFDWVAEYFALRCQYKHEGNPAEYVIKITLNSGYGKTAQRVGWDEKKNTPPPYHQLDWAGYITSHCRAQIWEGIASGTVFQVETDAVFSTIPLNLPLVSGKSLPEDLGKWELTEHSAMISVQNGVYWTRTGDEWREPKVRGMRKGSKGTSAYDALAYLQRLASQGRSAEPLTGNVLGFYGQPFRGSRRYMTWAEESRVIQFGGEGKRFWPGTNDPSCNLVILHNGSIRLADFDSQPHALPWEPNEIAKAIRDADRDAPDYGGL